MTTCGVQRLAVEELADGEIIARVLAGDADAFALLIRKYNGIVLMAVRGVFYNEQDVREAVQDVYIRAFTKLDSFRGGSFKAWLRVIARNASLSLAQRAYRKKEISCEEIPEIEPEYTLSSFLEDRETYRIVWRLMSKLPTRQSRVFYLRYFEHLSYREIAEIIGRKPATVGSLLFHAHARCRELYESGDY